MSLRLTSTALLLLLLPLLLPAQEADDLEIEYDEEAMAEAYRAWADSVAASLTYYADTTLLIGDGLATLTVPDGYKFIYGEDARTVLVDMWGNPPDNGIGSLGMLFPRRPRPGINRRLRHRYLLHR